MKNLILLILFLPVALCAQVPNEPKGLAEGEDHFLTDSEIEYTKTILTNLYQDSSFNLIGKRILFSTGNFGTFNCSKSKFYNSSCIPWTDKGSLPHVNIIILTESEIEKIGFDIVLIAWSKFSPEGKARKRFIKNALKQSVTN